MNESDWLACTEPSDMLAFVGHRLSLRKEVLFVVACCRKFMPLNDAALQAGLTALERYADAEVSKEEAQRAASVPVVSFLLSRLPGLSSDYAQDWAVQSGQADSTVALIRDLFNPFRPVSLDPAWLSRNDGTVRKMAQGIYVERRFEDLPVLADALEDAGCTHAGLLGHCRHDLPHYRGCWVLDCLLAKE
jgi:hypothetical protein